MTIERLPPEVECLIFLHVIPMHDIRSSYPRTGRTILALGAVCRAWRRAAWDCPHLWNTPYLYLQRDADRALQQAQLFKEWLSRSGDLPLSIEITQSEIPPMQLVEPAIEIIFRTIDGCAGRLEHLALRVATSAFSRFGKGLHLPLLRSVVIFSPQSRVPSDSTGLHLVDTPQLHSVVLNCESPHLGCVTLQWSLISRLTLRNLALDECLHILESTSRLTHFDVGELLNSFAGGFQLPSQPLLLPSLQRVCIMNTKRASIFQLLHRITIPNASEFVIRGFRLSMFPIADFASLIERSGCALTTLSFRKVYVCEDDLHFLLPLLPSLVSFSLCMFPRAVFDDGNTIGTRPLPGLTDRILGMLDASAANSIEVCLPHLTSFTYRGIQTFSWDALTKTMESRRVAMVPATSGEPVISLIDELEPQNSPQPRFIVQIYEAVVSGGDRIGLGDLEGCMERIGVLRAAGMRIDITLPWPVVQAR